MRRALSSMFVAFGLAPSPVVKMIGLGMATAIAVDATLVRMVLLPATMALLGRANWWIPAWLDRLLPNLDPHVEVLATEPAGAEPVQAPESSSSRELAGV